MLLTVDSLQLEGQSNFHWLPVDEPVNHLFLLVRKFWSSEGFKVEIDQPAIGLSKTAWVCEKEGSDKVNAGFIEKLFSSDHLSATQNQFGTSIERDTQTGKNHIYIAHGETADSNIFQTKKRENENPNVWELIPPKSEFEVEKLSRLMIYFGVQRDELDRRLDRMKFFTPLASIHADYAKNKTYLQVKDVYSKVWQRTLHQLDRMGLGVVRSNIDAGLQTRGEIRVQTNAEEEITAGGFFSFGSVTKMVKKQVILVLTEESHKVTRISMVRPDGETGGSQTGVALISRLQKFLK